jgi:hypothetical protein
MYDFSKIKSMSPGTSSTNWGKSGSTIPQSGGVTPNTMPVDSVSKGS